MTFNGDVAKQETDLITRSIVKTNLQQDLGDRVNIINAFALLNEQGVTRNVEKEHHNTFSNYIQVHLVSDTEEVKIGATVIAGFGARIVRIVITLLTLNLMPINLFLIMVTSLVWSV